MYFLLENGEIPTSYVRKYQAMKHGPGMKMHFLLNMKMGIFQPSYCMLVLRVTIFRSLTEPLQGWFSYKLMFAGLGAEPGEPGTLGQSLKCHPL